MKIKSSSLQLCTQNVNQTVHQQITGLIKLEKLLKYSVKILAGNFFNLKFFIASRRNGLIYSRNLKEARPEGSHNYIKMNPYNKTKKKESNKTNMKKQSQPLQSSLLVKDSLENLRISTKIKLCAGTCSLESWTDTSQSQL